MALRWLTAIRSYALLSYRVSLYRDPDRLSLSSPLVFEIVFIIALQGNLSRAPEVFLIFFLGFHVLVALLFFFNDLI